MKKLLLICGLLTSTVSFGANWVYVVSSSNNQDIYVDKDFYKYNSNLKTVDVWTKTTKKKLYEEAYHTQSKALTRYSCENKSARTLAEVDYNESGESLRSSTKPASDFSLIFPDSIGEAIWYVACETKGKGFKLAKSN